MMRIRLILVCLIACSAHAATIGEWRQDIDAIVADIRTFHPNPFTKTGDLTFRRRVEALKESLPAMTQEQRVAELMRIVASIGDGHTQIIPHSAAFASWYPIRMYEFADGVFVTTAHESAADLAGAQILEIGGRPVGDVLRGARDLAGCDNAFDCEERLSAAHNAALMGALGFAEANGNLKLRLRLANGNVADRVLVPIATSDSSFDWRYKREVFGAPIGSESDWVTAFRGLAANAFRKSDESRPPHLTIARSFFSRAIPERDAYYIQSYQVGDAFAEGFPRALVEIDRLRPRRLIIDLRYNIGGDGSLVTSVVREFVLRSALPPWRELYLLTGRKTFSAGVMAAVAFIDNCALTIVGEPAGAARNSYGDAKERPYARIGVDLYVSTLRHQLGNSNDVRDTIAVDVPAAFTYAQWSSGEDPAVDPILRGDEMRSIAMIARAGGGAAARKTLQERNARFSRINWYEQPREIDLRAACRDLLGRKRVDDALETCTLNTEIHPFIWNTWWNLAGAQSAAGLYADRLSSLHRVLEIDPNNVNAHEIHGAFDAGLRPPVIRFGASVADMQSTIADRCANMILREIKPPFLSDVKTRQMQIDCEGFRFLGKPRHAEFVFRDDSLEMVWIMTTAEEKGSISAAMSAAYVEPPKRNANYEAFTRARAALRDQPAEVLFYSEALAAAFEEDFR